MLTQRVIHNPDGTAALVITAEPVAVPELVALAEELNLRSTIQTEGPIHILNDPAGNGTPSVPVIP